MAAADREYSLDTFIENLRYLENQGRASATIPELAGEHREPPAGGHPVLDLAGLQKRLLEAPPNIALPLGKDISFTVKKTEGGIFVSVQEKF
jgi:hypothetical protein